MALQPGQVRDAINAYLSSKKDGATIESILAAVSKSIGQDVSASSVRSYLRLNTPAKYERIGRGTYRLRG